MKKLSLIMAMVLIATIGGVYAEWVFNESIPASDHVHKSINLTGVTEQTDTTMGLIEIDLGNSSIKIDQANEAHEAEIEISGNIYLKFTPSAGASQDIKDNGIDMHYYLGSVVNLVADDLDNWKFEDKRIFNVDTATKVSVPKANFVKTTEGEKVVFVATLDASVVFSGLTFANVPVLDTKAKYDAFNLILTQGQIGVTAAAGLAPTNV